MSQIDAIYRDGAFQPLVPIHLRENQRVRLTFQPVEAKDAEEWLAGVRRRQQRMIEQHGFLQDSAPDIAADRLR